MQPPSGTLGRIALHGASAALGFAAAFFFAAPGIDKAPEFFGAFAAAIIAAAALIIATFYQNDLNRRRDQDARDRDRTASAIDLCFWLNHCDYELEFIANTLAGIQEHLMAQGQTHSSLPMETFRTVISPRFFDDLIKRAKQAAELPAEIAGAITRDLYKTSTISDRIFLLNHAASDFRPSLKHIEEYIFLINLRREALQKGARAIAAYLMEAKALPDFPRFGDTG